MEHRLGAKRADLAYALGTMQQASTQSGSREHMLLLALFKKALYRCAQVYSTWTTAAVAAAQTGHLSEFEHQRCIRSLQLGPCCECGPVSPLSSPPSHDYIGPRPARLTQRPAVPAVCFSSAQAQRGKACRPG